MESRETLTISLPPALREQIDEVVRSGGYGNTSEYVRELVREDLKQRAREALEAKLLEGLNSGSPREMNAEFWREMRERLHAKARDHEKSKNQ